MGTKGEGSADRADKDRSATHPVADRVRGTLRHLVEAVTRVLGHWEAVSDEARDVLGRLSRTAERKCTIVCVCVSTCASICVHAMHISVSRFTVSRHEHTD